MRLYEIIQGTEATSQDQYKIFVDLDGVLADFVTGIEKAVQTVHGTSDFEYSENRNDNDKKYRNMIWEAIDKYHKNHNGQLWYELPLLDDAPTLWKFVSQYDPQILSATGDPKYNAGEQKRQWVNEKLGSNVKVNLVRRAGDKQQYADAKHILIDDKHKAIDPWKQSGGIGVLHTSATNTIAQLKKLGL